MYKPTIEDIINFNLFSIFFFLIFIVIYLILKHI